MTDILNGVLKEVKILELLGGLLHNAASFVFNQCDEYGPELFSSR